MFKRILLLLILISNVSYSQLSNKHWLPPLHARDASVVGQHYLYLSTPELIPFEVSVTDGAGVPIAGSPFTISQGNPEEIFIGNGQNSKMFRPLADVNIVNSNLGLILEGSGDFYASFRVRSGNHAEILVSKGLSGAGTNFRVGSLPQNYDGGTRNFVTSFMAIENNTSVVVSDYDINVEFVSNTGNITDNSQSFILNQGESVILSGYCNIPANLTGFVGALLSSNKPIVVNTGNALAGMGTQSDGQDFNLDQIVSLEEIGTEYILVKGNGSANTELPLLIGTEDNTNIYINGNPLSVTTINAGDYFLVPTSFYQGVNNSNMYITSDKPIYVYQIIAGDISDATSGLNFIPPLSCFFQKSVDLIPNINFIGSTQYSAAVIAVTYATATVTINGIVTSSLPEPILGNTDWVSYKIPNVSGNTAIESTGPLAVGVFGFSGAAGFGGYYSGFGSEPRDTEVTVCSGYTVNLLDEIDGNPETGGTWTPTLSSGTDIFDPAVDVAGIYNYSYIGTCAIIDVDIDVSIQTAPDAGTNNSIVVCSNDNAFDLFNLLGPSAQPGGVWSPALASGTGMYNPSTDLTGTYLYTIPASGVCNAISATIDVTNNTQPSIVPIIDYRLCDDAVLGTDTDGISFFDLTTKNTEALGTQTGIDVTYHVLPIEAELGTNPITTINSGNTTIYVRLRNSTTGCFNVTSFNLVVLPKPTANAVVTLKQCDTDNDAITDFNLTEANSIISSEVSNTFTYHNTLLGAQNNTDLVGNEMSFNAPNGSQVWARIVNAEGCERTTLVNLVVSTTTIPSNYVFEIYECDDYINATDTDSDGFDYFNLDSPTSSENAIANLLSFFSSSQPLNVTFYENENDALAEMNAITNITNYRNITPNSQIIWARIDSELNNECFGIGPFIELIVNPLPEVDLGPDFVLCIDPVTGLGSQIVNATPSTPGNYSYQWTPVNPNGNSHLYTITTGGTFSVIVTNTDTNCVNSDTITTTFSSEPETFEANIITPAFSSGLASIEAIATGGFGTYEYSLNAIDWQSSPIFSGLENGSYIIYVRDIQGCGILFSEELQTITYPNYFTPNGDGYNDFWSIQLPSEYQGLISIFDRYGKLLKQINTQGQGWDGTYNGNQLPSTDYWFKVEYIENNKKKEFKSHFSLKR
jgi:gliding motility-associated-like protein